MALSGSLTTTKYNSDRYYELSWTATQSTANNTSTIKWTLSAKSGATWDNWYAERTLKAVIGGTTVFSKTDRVERYDGVIETGSLTLTHNTDGTKSFTASVEGAVYGSSVNVTGSKTFALDTIPRYATVSHSLNSKTETTVKMNWSSDSTIDYIWYSKDNGSSWTGVNVTDGKSGTYTISGLSPNATYKIKTRVRRKDSQLTTDSSALSVTTYAYPYCTKAPDFVIGSPVTLEFYNPLGRTFDFIIYGNGEHIYAWASITGTTCKCANEEEVVSYLYASIPTVKSAKYSVETVYNDVFTLKQGGTYSVDESKCKPTFTNFAYKDTNATVTAVTGNNQALVKGLSNLSVEITTANKMVAKNGANPNYYNATVDTKTSDNKAYSDTATVTIPIGTITSAGVKRLNVRAYDSRLVSTLAYKDVTVYDYEKPVINATLKRLNNFEAQTTISVSGTYSQLTIGSADKNAIQSVQYRYRETGGTWSDWETIVTTLTSGKFTCSNVVLSLDNTKSFEFEFKAKDKLGENTIPKTVDVGQAVFFVSSNKRTAYLNGEEVTTRNNVRELVNFIQLAKNTDLNTIVTPSTYRSVQASDTATMTNVPSGFNGGFTMYVYSWSGNQTSTAHRRQEIVYAGNTYVRRTLDGGATWSDWQRVAFSNDIANIAFPVGSVYITATNTNPATLLNHGTWAFIDSANGKYFWKRTA